MDILQSGEATMDWDQAIDHVNKIPNHRNPKEMLIHAMKKRELVEPSRRRMYELFRPTGISRSRTHWK